MNMEGVYGSYAVNLPRGGAQALALTSLGAIPPAISPLDTEKALQAAKKKQAQATGSFLGFAHPLAGLIIIIFVIWLAVKIL